MTGKTAMVNDLFDLRDQVAVVTGGARDLGLHMAHILAAAGADLVITSRNAERAEAGAAELREAYGIEVLPLGLDHTDHAQVCELADAAQAWKGRIDILLNNAGGVPPVLLAGSLFEREAQTMEKIIQMNLTGVLFCCQQIGRIMVEQGRGKIVNIASIAGLVGRDRRMYERNGLAGTLVEYAAAKAGVIGMTRDLAGLLSPSGIHVNCISPGGFERSDMPPGFVRDYSDRTPLGRMGRDEIDLKGAALFLASPASDYITGQNLVVDGGFSLWH